MSGRPRNLVRQGAASNPDAGARIKQRLGKRGVAWLTSVTGLADSTIRDALERGPARADVALRIAQALDVNLEWLLVGESCPSELSPLEAYDLAGRLSQTMIPEFDLAYGMGGGTFAETYVRERKVPFRQDWLDRLSGGRWAQFFLAKGAGDSMMPTILNGDDILVNAAEKLINSQDRVWALAYGDALMIKRVRRMPGGEFLLNSDNPIVHPLALKELEFEVIGRVVWIGRAI